MFLLNCDLVRAHRRFKTNRTIKICECKDFKSYDAPGGDAASNGWVLSSALPGGCANLLAIARLWYLGGTGRHGLDLG